VTLTHNLPKAPVPRPLPEGRIKIITLYANIALFVYLKLVIQGLKWLMLYLWW